MLTPIRYRSGNSYDNRSYPSGDGYHYSNAYALLLRCRYLQMLITLSHSNGSYYYSNPNGSTYYNSGKSPSSPIQILVGPVLILVLQVMDTPSTTPPAALLPSTTGMPLTRAASRICAG
jgi:hypothetical protein